MDKDFIIDRIEWFVENDGFEILEVRHIRNLHWFYTISTFKRIKDILLVIHTIKEGRLFCSTYEISRGNWGDSVIKSVLKYQHTIPYEWINFLSPLKQDNFKKFLGIISQKGIEINKANAIKAPKFELGELWYSKDSKGIHFKGNVVYRRFVVCQISKRGAVRFMVPDETVVRFSREYFKNWMDIMVKVDPERETEFLLEYA